MQEAQNFIPFGAEKKKSTENMAGTDRQSSSNRNMVPNRLQKTEVDL